MSARQVTETINQKYGTTLARRTVADYVNKGMIGMSPVKKGKSFCIPPDVFQEMLLIAYESFIRINQLNSTTSKCNRSSLTKLVNAVTNKMFSSHFLFNKLLSESTVDFQAAVISPVEERRLRWTTYNNLNQWFMNWEQDLLGLGFATMQVDVEGNEYIHVSDEQKARILNLDESALHLDGNHCQRGGRPEVKFYDAGLPSGGVAVSKTSQSTTFIAGSNALGEAIPPHFQFSTTSKSSDTERIRLEVATFMMGVRGKFGFESVQTFPCTIGLNEKGGMDAAEFEEYLFINIVRLYPDAADIPGKRVMAKLDSGPARANNMCLMARLRNRGIYLYPCVPNTTAVTQETDQSYGPFKTAFRANLSKICDDRLTHNKPIQFAPYLCGLFVFGGTDPETGLSDYRNAFEEAFSTERCVAVWEKVGAVPFTRACLQDPKVRREQGDVTEEEDPMQLAMKEMQQANDNATNLLILRGYQGNLLQAKLKQHKERAALTVPLSNERQLALANAKSHGAVFAATGGTHFTCDDMFLAAEIEPTKKAIKELEKEKKRWEVLKLNQEKALAVLALGKPIANLRVSELEILLKWHDNDNWKGGNKEEKCIKWQAIVNSGAAPADIVEWTEEHNNRLQTLKSKKLTIKDTALGRLREENERELKATFQSKTVEERQTMLEELQKMHHDSEDVKEAAI